MTKLVRHEHIAPGSDGARQVAPFWIAGPLKAIEARAERQNAPDGHKPSGTEIMVAIGIAIVAIFLVLSLL